MTNLKKGSSHDFDLLAENKGIALGDSENLTLILGKFSPYPIEVTIIPALGKARVEVYFRELHQKMIFELPLAIAHEMEIPFSWVLGILHKQEDLELSIPLARILNQVLDMAMPLHVKIARLKILVSELSEIKYKVYFEGKPEAKAETLEELRKLLKEE